jgi:hypothetical protein
MLLDEIWNKVLNPIHTLHPYRAKVFFSLTVLAPVGKQFKVHSAVGSSGMVLSFCSPLSIWLAHGWNEGLRNYAPTTISFTGFEGPSWHDNRSGITVDHDGQA